MARTGKILPLLIVISILAIFITCSQGKRNDYFLNATEITDHPDTSQVIKLLNAQPDSAFNRLILGKERFIQLYYKLDSSEFRYKKGRLIEVIIHKPLLSYKPQSIVSLGLPYKNPTSEDSAAFVMWRNVYDGFDVINFYRVGQHNRNRKVTYKIYLKLK